MFFLQPFDQREQFLNALDDTYLFAERRKRKERICHFIAVQVFYYSTTNAIAELVVCKRRWKNVVKEIHRVAIKSIRQNEPTVVDTAISFENLGTSEAH